MEKYDTNYKVAMAREFYELNRQGDSFRKIAKKYGMSHHTVKNWMDEHGFLITIWHTGKLKDISNQTFGLITVIIRLSKRSTSGDVYWLCFCACNPDKLLEIIGSDLRRRRKTHCGCNFQQKIDISGQVFGYLTAIRDSGLRRKKHIIWVTKCICGKKHLVAYQGLVSGKVSSCGCQRPKGHLHYNWNGGTSDLKIYLRNVITEWKKESLKKANFRCVITNNLDSKENPLEVHHLTKSFDSIFKETFQECNLEIYRNRGDYTKEELDLLTATIIKKHFEYALGVVLVRSLHNKFHSTYYPTYGYDVPAEEFYNFLRLETQQNP